MSTWKLVQRRCYDLLSNKYSLLVILIAFTCIFIGIVHFGEVWLAWSKEKYEAVFHSFNDNILGISFQKKLCQHVPIDVVYTWVNGSDPTFLQNLQKYIPVTDVNVVASRFDDKDELRYSLRSLEMYAPWVRHVYIVTNGQIPSWLDMDNPRMTLITHEDIFLSQDDLPTFSSPAIESHIHRIPNLSDKFLYFNDDVLLGTEVWPEDFITQAGGQKVYLAWLVPDCSEICPWAWVGDGACDPTCNTTLCEFDGGDCDATPVPTESESVDEGSDYPFKFLRETQIRNRDAVRILDILKKRNSEAPATDIKTPSRSLKAYGDKMPKRFGRSIQSTRQLEPPKNINYQSGTSNLSKRRTRKISPIIQMQSNMLSVVQNRKHISTDSNNSNANVNNTNPIVRKSLKMKTSYLQGTMRKLKLAEGNTERNSIWKGSGNNSNIANNIFLDIVNSDELNAPFQFENLVFRNSLSPAERTDSVEHIKLRRMFSADERNASEKVLTIQLQNSSQTNLGTTENLIALQRRAQVQRYLNDDIINLVHVNNSIKSLKFKNADQYEAEYEDDEVQPTQWKHRTRKLDTYAESLLYVNRIYNTAYGFHRRRVPAHMPHLLDKRIVSDMQTKFEKEFTVTWKHRVRDPEDMQFAFSYFYFLMSEQMDVPVSDIFDVFDTDKSGTWSDREIRTLLSRVYPLPLDYSLVMDFENEIINCSNSIDLVEITHSQPGERYLDSTLPIVTKELILRCESVSDLIHVKFGKRKRYHHEVVKGDKKEVFKMLTSNVSLTVQLLDELRKEPKKFICLNDNMDPHRRSENEVVRALLSDFYRSLYPLRSTFELPAQYRNRFSHRHDLLEWRASRTKARNLLLGLLALLLVATLHHMFYHQVRRLLRIRAPSILLV